MFIFISTSFPVYFYTLYLCIMYIVLCISIAHCDFICVLSYLNIYKMLKVIKSMIRVIVVERESNTPVKSMIQIIVIVKMINYCGHLNFIGETVFVTINNLYRKCL